MPLFYFDLHEGEIISDHEGLELPDTNAAIQQAIRALPTIASEAIAQGDDHQNFSITVRDRDRRPVYTAALSFCGTRL